MCQRTWKGQQLQQREATKRVTWDGPETTGQPGHHPLCLCHRTECSWVLSLVLQLVLFPGPRQIHAQEVDTGEAALSCLTAFLPRSPPVWVKIGLRLAVAW